MRILFITHYFHPEGNAPATRVHQLTRRWARAGHDVTVITAVPNVPSGIAYEGYRNRWRQNEQIEGVDVVRVWTYLAANAGTVRRILSYLSFMLTSVVAGLSSPRPDIVIATSPQFFCGWAGRLVARLRRLPFVLEVRDLWPESIVAVGAMRSSPLLRILGWLEHRLYDGAAIIVTVGQGYACKLLERGVIEDRIRIVPNGVDLSAFVPDVDGSLLRTEFNLGDRFVCAFAGTIGMASGLDVIIRAAESLRRRSR
ncbi:MAG TPA: glycosyltransferase family 4 protein, partial [Rhodothermales bacterium]